MHTVLDSSNLDAILADAGYEPPEPKVDPTKEEPEKGAEPDADDVEGTDGLTPREKRELTTKMLKSVGKRVAQRKDAEEFAAAQKQRAEELERENAELRAKIPPPQPPKGRPERAQFATEQEFLDASIQYGVDEGIRKRDAEREEAAKIERAGKALEKAAKIVPDFAEVTSANMNWPGMVVQHMRGSDLFAELGYHFYKNPSDLTRIANLPAEKQLVELGKIEAILAPFGETKVSSKAKDEDTSSSTDTGFSPSKARSDAPVISPLSGSTQLVERDPGEMNTRETIQTWSKDHKLDLRKRRRH